ncbi:hypothetical protein RND81_06G032000 [Saponaria officinalis]|uniref:Uncharacterized protein n=1 Tax=Saponaria officinalis TaxID=3572 RepID=A0AAW1K8D7_SAPOF
MVRAHTIGTLALFLTLLAQMLSTEGRAIKSPSVKITSQETSSKIPQTNTYEKNLPSLETTHKLPKGDTLIDSPNVKKVDSDGQGDRDILKSHDDNHSLAPRRSIIHSPGHSSTNQIPKSPRTWTNIPASTYDNRLKTPGHSIGAADAKESSNEANLRNTVRKLSRSPPSFFFTASAMAHENEFRPTAPGTSPGAGHADTTKYEKEESSHCLHNKCTDDLRPTAPGDSPRSRSFFCKQQLQ